MCEEHAPEGAGHVQVASHRRPTHTYAIPLQH